MALKGRIEEFGLAELLQLIVQNQKRGTILLSDDVDEVRLSISEGAIVRCENESRPQESELASRLATVGVINGAQLGRLLKVHAETDEKMALMLIDGGYAPVEVVRQFATLQAVDTLFETFMWPSGSYAFEEGAVDLAPPWIEPIRADYFLVRGIEIVDEWPKINALIPSTSLKVRRVRDLGGAGAGAGASGGSGSAGSIGGAASFGAHAALVADLHLDAVGSFGTIGECEREMFELCRSGLHVKTVLDRMPWSRFEASRALANLIRGGYVKID